MNGSLAQRRHHFLSARFIAAALATMCGCGESGPPRHQLTGEVTFQGRPVPVGTIVFEPDVERGNSGPGAAAIIKDGRYATELGVVGGPHRVRITGSDGVPVEVPDEGFPSPGKALFPEYRTTADLPHSDSEWNVAIP